ncbi:hypothetical protein AHAS_Ahas05G0215300 [Arachis hypogaea]
MEVPLHARFITLEVNCKATMGIKSVGIAMIPVSDIVGGVKMPEISSLLPPAINGLPAQGVPVTGKSSNAL